MALYEYLKKRSLNNEVRDLTPLESSINGAICGATSAFLTTPMDVVKTKLMT